MFLQEKRMSVQLQQFALFATLIGELEALRPSEIEEYCPTEEPVGKEVVVGTLPIHLRALFALRSKYLNEVELAHYEFRLAVQHNSPNLEDLKTQGISKDMRARGVDELFWYALRTEFPELHTKPEIGCSANWKVHYTDGPMDQVGRGKVRGVMIQLLASRG